MDGCPLVRPAQPGLRQQPPPGPSWPPLPQSARRSGGLLRARPLRQPFRAAPPPAIAPRRRGPVRSRVRPTQGARLGCHGPGVQAHASPAPDPGAPGKRSVSTLRPSRGDGGFAEQSGGPLPEGIPLGRAVLGRRSDARRSVEMSNAICNHKPDKPDERPRRAPAPGRVGGEFPRVGAQRRCGRRAPRAGSGAAAPDTCPHAGRRGAGLLVSRRERGPRRSPLPVRDPQPGRRPIQPGRVAPPADRPVRSASAHLRPHAAVAHRGSRGLRLGGALPDAALRGLHHLSGARRLVCWPWRRPGGLHGREWWDGQLPAVRGQARLHPRHEFQCRPVPTDGRVPGIRGGSRATPGRGRRSTRTT